MIFILKKIKEIKHKTYFMSSNFLILMSGGTTPVINSTLNGIVEKIKKKSSKIKVFSGYPGIDGVLKNNFVELNKFSKLKLKKISKTPGSHIIGTTRLKKLNNREILIFKKNLIKKNITKIINIGGNGTLQQTIDLSKRLKNFNFISCPKTVDNDLGDLEFKKMLFNPGFASCVNIWKFFLDMINIENIGAKSHDKIIISQTFGRNTGFICGSIRYWDKKRELPIMLLLPEDKKNFSDILKFVKSKIKKYDRLMIFLSEGYNLSNIMPKYDKSGQIMYGSSGTSSAQILSNKLNKNGIQSRIFNPTILQRVFSYKNQVINIKDNLFAKKVGTFAAKSLLENKKSFLIGLSEKKTITFISFKDCKNYSRKMPNRFINKGKFDVSDDYIKYLNNVMN